MAVQIDTTLPCGILAANAYWRLNNFDTLPNRDKAGNYSEPAVARFRPFASEADFKAGLLSLDPSGGMDVLVSFAVTEIGANLAAEAYAALKAETAFASATDA